MKEFTGNKKIFIEIKNFLFNEGFSVLDAIHVGDNKYEFEENWLNGKLGCHNLHKILAWKENNEIKYKAVVVGWCCND